MDFSIVIPGFNRVAPLKQTLLSVSSAIEQSSISAEIILVDDGSEPSLSNQLANFNCPASIHHVRQQNQGSIVARLTGLQAATGTYLLFLDSDDLIHPLKLKLHYIAHESNKCDVVYDDMALAEFGPNNSVNYSPGTRFESTSESTDLFLIIQPAPHGPTYRRSYLNTALSDPIVPLDRRMDAAGDVWLYYNLLIHPAKIHKINEPLTAIGPHVDIRYSQHWEKLGAAALLIAEQFTAFCPQKPETQIIRTTVGQIAFRSWRKLPRDYPKTYCNRLLNIWRKMPRGCKKMLGGTTFQVLAAIVGIVTAGRLLRRFNHNYASCRTLTDDELSKLIASTTAIPTPHQ